MTCCFSVVSLNGSCCHRWENKEENKGGNIISCSCYITYQPNNEKRCFILVLFYVIALKLLTHALLQIIAKMKVTHCRFLFCFSTHLAFLKIYRIYSKDILSVACGLTFLYTFMSTHFDVAYISIKRLLLLTLNCP